MLRKGFTLAEVLITLGIIGIVAALTITNLITGYRKKIVETRLAKLYSTINQAIKMSEVSNGDCKYWEWGNINNHRDSEFMELWWKKYMNNYMPYVIYTKRDSTTSDSVSGNGGYKVYFKDGSALRIEALPGWYAWFILYPDAKLSQIKNGRFEATNEKPGRNYFAFYIWPQKKCAIVPHANNQKSHEEKITQCLNDYNGISQTLGIDCARLIMDNGWKIPNDYPIKF